MFTTNDSVVKTEVCYLNGLLLKEGQCICKDINGFHSLPIGCVEVRLDGQILSAGRKQFKKGHEIRTSAEKYMHEVWKYISSILFEERTYM